MRPHETAMGKAARHRAEGARRAGAGAAHRESLVLVEHAQAEAHRPPGDGVDGGRGGEAAPGPVKAQGAAGDRAAPLRRHPARDLENRRGKTLAQRRARGPRPASSRQGWASRGTPPGTIAACQYAWRAENGTKLSGSHCINCIPPGLRVVLAWLSNSKHILDATMHEQPQNGHTMSPPRKPCLSKYARLRYDQVLKQPNTDADL